MFNIDDKLQKRIDAIGMEQGSLSTRTETLDMEKIKSMLSSVISQGVTPINMILPIERDGVKSEIHICAIPEEFIVDIPEKETSEDPRPEPVIKVMCALHGDVVREDGEIHPLGQISAQTNAHPRGLVLLGRSTSRAMKGLTHGSVTSERNRLGGGLERVPVNELKDIDPELLMEKLLFRWDRLERFLQGETYSLATPMKYTPGGNHAQKNKDFRSLEDPWNTKSIASRISYDSLAINSPYGSNSSQAFLLSSLHQSEETYNAASFHIHLKSILAPQIDPSDPSDDLVIDSFIPEDIEGLTVKALNEEYGTDFSEKGSVTDVLSSLYKMNVDSAIKQHAATLNAQIDIKMSKAGIDRPDGLMQALYPPVIENFIVSAETPDSCRYRKEFVDKVYTQMYGSLDGALESLDITPVRDGGQVSRSMSQSRSVLVMTLPVFDDFIRRNYESTSGVLKPLDDKILGLIDEGVYPWRQVSEKLGFKTVSKKQFESAMRGLGKSRSRHKEIGNSSSLSLTDALSLAKFPENWLDMNKDWEVLWQRPFTQMLPFMLGVGKKIDRLQHGKDKPGLAQLSGKHKWMVHKTPEEFKSKLHAFDEKYKFTAERLDYGTLLGSMIEALALRTLLDAPGLDHQDTVNFSTNSNELDIDEKKVYELLMEVMHSEIQDDPEWDEENEEYIEPTDPSEYISGVSFGGELDVGRTVRASGVEVKTFAEMNRRLHKEYNHFIQLANTFSDNNITWEGLFDTPREHKGYLFVPIDNRLDLLNEGQQQQHCVFSYLGPCMSGESSIVSVKDPETMETVATVEFTSDGANEEGVDLNIAQCYGAGNSTVDHDIHEAVEDLVEKISTGEIQVNNFEEQESVDNSAVLDEVEDHPLANGAIVKSIPYDTSAAYLAYFFLQRHLPDGVDVESLLCTDEGAYEVFYRSEFSKDINLIKELNREYGVSPANIVSALQLDNRGGLNYGYFNSSPEDAHEAIRERVEVSTYIANAFKSLDGDMPIEHAANQVSLNLNSEMGVEIPADTLVEAYEKGSYNELLFEKPLIKSPVPDVSNRIDDPGLSAAPRI